MSARMQGPSGDERPLSTAPRKFVTTSWTSTWTESWTWTLTATATWR
jgi:hypothetical protein